MASGRVWVPERVTIAARAAGLVVAVVAVAGQRVAAGELRVQLDDAEARNAVRQAETAVAQAEARVAQLRRVGSIVATEALKQAQTQLEHAQADLESTTKLMPTRAVATDTLDDARRAVEIAQAGRNVALAQQLAATPAGADSRVVLTAQLQAEAQLEGARLRLEQRRLLASGPGGVLTRAVERGDTVSPGQALLTLAMDAAPQLAFQPDERNLALLALGRKAVASADAWPQTRFDAEPSYIAPAVDPQRGSIEVRLRVPNPPAFLRPDMTVSVDLTVARKAQILTLPAEAVRDAAAGQAAGASPRALAASEPAPAQPTARTGRYLLWHELLRRVFEIDVLACPKCGARLRLLCTVHDGFSARRSLQGASAQAPPAEARPPPGPVETTST